MSWKKCTILENSFPELNVSVEFSKDKAQALKDYQENAVNNLPGKPSVAAHEVYEPLHWTYSVFIAVTV